MTTTRVRRRGVTIIELMVVITALAILLGLTIGLMHSLLKLDRGARAHFVETSARARLAHQFRRDVHEAARVVPDAKPFRLVRGDGRVIEYQARAGQILRAERKSETDEAVDHRETFRFPHSGTAQFSIGLKSGRTRAEVVIPPQAAASPIGPPRDFTVEAFLSEGPPRD